MLLTKRDALVALLAGGGVWGIAVGTDTEQDSKSRTLGSGGVVDETDIETLTAVAEIVYPSEVTATGGFVRQYVGGLPERKQNSIAATATDLRKHSYRVRGEVFKYLTTEARDELLRGMGVDRSGSAPDGTLAERVRYHVVNQLLYGLYTHPRGGELIGIENPVGYPGGHESYQNPPSGVEQSAVNHTHDTLQADE